MADSLLNNWTPHLYCEFINLCSDRGWREGKKHKGCAYCPKAMYSFSFTGCTAYFPDFLQHCMTKHISREQNKANNSHCTSSRVFCIQKHRCRPKVCFCWCLKISPSLMTHNSAKPSKALSAHIHNPSLYSHFRGCSLWYCWIVSCYTNKCFNYFIKDIFLECLNWLSLT